MKESRLTTQQWLQALIEPGFILSKAMSYYIETNLKAILRGQVLAPVLRSQELRDEAFGRFWVAFSSNRADLQPTLVADSQPQAQNQAQAQTPPGEIQNSTELIPAILAQASGLVLDVGPGTGTQMPLLKSPAIKAIYGAEPCVGLHAELRKRAADEGLSEKYTILPSSVVQKELEGELEKHGLVSEGGERGGVFDTIITVRVLCSVPEFERTTAELYSLLKPGGKMLVVEHVVNPWMTPKGSVLARVLQGVYHAFGWRWVMGNCCMNRNTKGVLSKVAEKDGGWESFEMDRWFGTTCLPYITGVLVKRK